MKYFQILAYLLMSLHLSAQNTILWQVNHPEYETQSYLLGTFHQFGNSFVDSLPRIQESLLASDLIIFESIDSKDELINLMNKRECTNKTEKLIGKKNYKKLKYLARNWSVDPCKLTTTEIFGKLNQELVRLKCNTSIASDEWNHFDYYLKHLSLSNNKMIKGLESDSLQLKLINEDWTVNSKRSDKNRLKQIIELMTNDKTDDFNCSIAIDYRNFILSYEFGNSCDGEGSLKFRNDNWLKDLPEDLKTQNCFVAVGLKHLMLDCGLITKLRSKGFIIKPIELKRIQ